MTHVAVRPQGISPGTGAAPAGHVLVVDDDPGMARSLAELLALEGHTAVAAFSVAEARERLEAESFDLVLTDVRMPGGGGIALLRASRDSDPERPVIMMTAFATVESAVGALNDGAYDYLIKPIDQNELFLTTRRAIEKRRLHQATRNLMGELRRTNHTLARRVAELNVLHEVSAALSSTAELSELLEDILRHATQVVGARYGSILLTDTGKNVLVIEAVTGESRSASQERTVAMEDSIAGYVATSGEPLLIEDVESDARFGHRNRRQFETKSLIVAPLKTPKAVLGALCLSDRTDQSCFTEDDLRILVTLAAQAAMAIDDARHYQEVSRRLAEVTALHDLAGRLSAVERTDQMVMAVFAAFDQLLQSDSLQWWRWDSAAGVVRLDTDTHQPLAENPDGAITVALDAALLRHGAGHEESVRGALTAAGWGYPPGAILTISVGSTDQPLGLFAVLRRDSNPFDENELRLAHLVGSLAERIFERQRALLNASRLVTMGKMMSEISHDLRKPLTNIRGSLQVLMAKHGIPAETTEILKATEQEVVRLAALVTELVEFSNPTRYRTERRDFRPILLRSIELIEQSAGKHGIAVVTDIPPRLRSIFCDDNQMIEAILNILINAVEAMESGGTLTVAAAVEPDPSGEREWVVVTISDTGPGMARPELDRIFERYYTTKETGTGLGLAAVQRIIGACDGTIDARSTPGEGTAFTLRLPVH